MKRAKVVLAVACAATLVGCARGSSSTPDQEAAPSVPPTVASADSAWVTSNGGTPTAGGWTASEDSWRGVWPWQSSTAVVACSSDHIGYVSLDDGSRYLLSGEIQSVGEQSLYSGNGLDAAHTVSQIAAEQKWADEAQIACPS